MMNMELPELPPLHPPSYYGVKSIPFETTPYTKEISSSFDQTIDYPLWSDWSEMEEDSLLYPKPIHLINPAVYDDCIFGEIVRS